jgi:hypothetical protein
MLGDLIKRQQSGANELLNLLEDPYQAQVSSPSEGNASASTSDSMIACCRFSLRKYRYFIWLHSPPRHRFLPSSTLQLPGLLAEAQSRRRSTCASADGKGHFCLGWTRSSDQGARFSWPDWSRCYSILKSVKDVPEHVSSDCCPWMWHLDPGQPEQGSAVVFIDSSRQDNTSHHLWKRQLGHVNLCVAVRHNDCWVSMVQLQGDFEATKTVLR